MNQLPKFFINPLGIQHKLYWTPEVYQTVPSARANYLNSLWLGTAWQVVALPYRVLRECLWPLFNFDIATFLLSLVMIPASVVWMLLWGITGRLAAHGLTLEELRETVVLNRPECLVLLEKGHTDMVLKVAELPVP